MGSEGTVVSRSKSPEICMSGSMSVVVRPEFGKGDGKRRSMGGESTRSSLATCCPWKPTSYNGMIWKEKRKAKTQL